MLEAVNLTKYYDNQIVLDQLNLKLNKGETLGIIGQNGAGKTTAFRIILDFIQPDSGKIIWNKSYKEVLNNIGYLPEERGLDLKRSIEEQIIFFGKLKGMSTSQIITQMNYWFQEFQVTAFGKQKIGSLSKGNRQKVQLICSIIHNPDFLILDEPYSGLDPVNASLLSNGIDQLKKLGTTIIFSSHNMNNVEDVSDKLIMLKEGKTVLNGTVDQIKNQFGKTNILIENNEKNKSIFKNDSRILSIQENIDNTLELKISDENTGREIFDIVTEDGFTSTFKQTFPSLEEIFKIKAGG